MEYIDKLNKLSNDRLVDVVKNYKRYGYPEQYRKAALDILDHRGIPLEMLKLTGNLENQELKKAENAYASFIANSRGAFVMYLLFWGASLALNDHEDWGIIVLTVLFAVFYLFLIRAELDKRAIYKHTGRPYGTGSLILFSLAGIPFFPIVYLLIRKSLKKELYDLSC